MKEKKKNIIAYVMNLPGDTVTNIRRYEKIAGKKYRVMLIWHTKIQRPDHITDFDILVECDFSKPHKIAEALLPYHDELLAITCRSEAYMSRFSQVIPHVPYLRTPTTESIKWSTDKYEMRRRLKLFDSKNTPRFTRVLENTKEERKRIREMIKFPLIIKPANLAASLFVSICYHEEELESTLRTAFRKIRKAYENDKRTEEPKIIAEEYMDGDMYSIDSYVNSRGEVYHCPLVKVVTGKKIGRDDFYNYLQMTPTVFKRSTVEKAEEVATTAIHALGLRSTTVHIELMKIDDEWKVIELGPRVGGFRDLLHRLSCDINHTMNDVLIRIPQKPNIPKKCKGYAAAMKWFTAKEGTIIEMKGIKKIESLESFDSMQINKKIGDRALFAKNGGRSVFNLFLYNSERSKLLADIRRVEQLVKVKVKTNRTTEPKTS